MADLRYEGHGLTVKELKRTFVNGKTYRVDNDSYTFLRQNFPAVFIPCTGTDVIEVKMPKEVSMHSRKAYKEKDNG